MANYSKREERRKAMLEGIERKRREPVPIADPRCKCGMAAVIAVHKKRSLTFWCRPCAATDPAAQL